MLAFVTITLFEVQNHLYLISNLLGVYWNGRYPIDELKLGKYKANGQVTIVLTPSFKVYPEPEMHCDPRYCLNKGRCYIENYKQKCDCLNSGYKGERCETRKWRLIFIVLTFDYGFLCCQIRFHHICFAFLTLHQKLADSDLPHGTITHMWYTHSIHHKQPLMTNSGSHSKHGLAMDPYSALFRPVEATMTFTWWAMVNNIFHINPLLRWGYRDLKNRSFHHICPFSVPIMFHCQTCIEPAMMNFIVLNYKLCQSLRYEYGESQHHMFSLKCFLVQFVLALVIYITFSDRSFQKFSKR